MTFHRVKLYSPLNTDIDDLPPTSPTMPTSPSATDVREHLADIQFTAHKCANLAQAIIVKENKLIKSNAAPSRDEDSLDSAKPARSFSFLPETVPVSELTTIKGLLEDIWQMTVSLSGTVFFLASASPLLRHRIHNVTRDVSHHLVAVCAELQSWLGGEEEVAEPLTPVSMESEGEDPFAKATSESAPPSHVSLVLDVMLALLEASSGMLASMSRLRTSPNSEESRESKDRVSAYLDRARFQEHMYHPEDEGMSAAYAEADRLGIRSLESHVTGLTSYLWFDFGSSGF
jgi:hypothetical protein